VFRSGETIAFSAFFVLERIGLEAGKGTLFWVVIWVQHNAPKAVFTGDRTLFFCITLEALFIGSPPGRFSIMGVHKFAVC
jgi:hypothetical protein